MKQSVFSKRESQSGVVLVVSLVMLLLLTLIGVTGMQVSGLEEKMAGNNKDKNIAFQAAETALRSGEEQVDAIVAIGGFDGNNGLLGEDDALPGFDVSATWTGSNSRIFVSEMSEVATEPRYYIKHISTGADGSGASINNDSYGQSNSGSRVSYFSVTSRGTGGLDTSQVFLRSYYGKRF